MTHDADRPDRDHGILRSEAAVLRSLVRSERPCALLEIGMANGASTVLFLETLRDGAGGHVTSIDPFQLATAGPEGGVGYGGAGVRAVEAAGFGADHTLLDTYDYLALPDLVRQGRAFDVIFIDGYHAFDYVMLNTFYADLLLRVGGLMLFHDANRPTVLRACEFFLANRAYDLVGPSPLVRLPRPQAALRRLWHLVSGQHGRHAARRREWKSLVALRKTGDGLADEDLLHWRRPRR